MEISKELLEKVLGKNIISFTVHTGFIFIQEKSISYNLNTYEFAFKCKEWARKNKYRINSMFNAATIINSKMEAVGFKASSEVEAIIKACEWILEQSK